MGEPHLGGVPNYTFYLLFLLVDVYIVCHIDQDLGKTRGPF